MISTVDDAFEFQILSGNSAVFRHDGCPFDLVDQFADVTWPFVLLDRSNGIVAETDNAPIHLFGEGFQKRLSNDQCVPGALPEWRDVQGDFTDPVIQVFPESSFFD